MRRKPPQLNIRVTRALERDLKRYMEIRGISTMTEAVRTAVEEALVADLTCGQTNWTELIGIAIRGELAPRSQWLDEDDLWGARGRR